MRDLLPSVPWALVEPHSAQAMKNHGQTLAQLANRQGLSFCELAAVLEDRDWRKITDVEALAIITRALVSLSTTPHAEARREVAARCRSMIEVYAPFHTVELNKLLKDAADMLEK